MPAAVQPPIFTLGSFRIFLAGPSAPPSSTSDGTFQTGDWIVNGSPTGSGVAAWVCCSTGPASFGTWKSIVVQNSF